MTSKKILAVLKTLIGQNNYLRFKAYKQRTSSKEKSENLKRSLFYGNFVNKGDVCFDVGANMGNRITPLLNIGAKVVAIEPQECCHKYLKVVFGGKIKLITDGLGEEEGIKKFHISNASTISSFSDEWINCVKADRFKEYNWDTTVEIKMTTLDILIKKFGTPSFIKIDVEGYELEVLKGLTHPIKMISFEYTVPEQTHKALQCIEAIQKNGGNLLCNFSISESMDWANKTWWKIPEFLEYIKTEEFANTGFGDIYVKLDN